MTKSETITFLAQTFARVPEIALASAQMGRMGAFSGGHPYLLQLLGDHLYRLVEEEFSPLAGEVVPVPDWVVDRAERRSLVEYKENVLDDVLRGVHPKTREYIELAYSLRDHTGLIQTATLNERLGKSARGIVDPSRERSKHAGHSRRGTREPALRPAALRVPFRAIRIQRIRGGG